MLINLPLPSSYTCFTEDDRRENRYSWALHYCYRQLKPIISQGPFCYPDRNERVFGIVLILARSGFETGFVRCQLRSGSS